MRYKWGRIGFVFNVIFVDVILSHINEYQFIHKCGCCVIYQWGRFGLLSTIWVGAVSVSIMIVEAVSMRPFRHARRSVGPLWVGAVSVEAVSGGAVLVMSYFGAVWVEAVSEWGRFDQLPYNHRMITLVYQSVSHTLSTTYHPKFSVVIIWKIKGLNSNSQSSKKFWLFFFVSRRQLHFKFSVGFQMLSTACWLEMLQGAKKGGSKLYISPNFDQKWVSKYGISSFLLKYKGWNYTNFPEAWKRGSKWRSTYSNLHRVSTLPGEVYLFLYPGISWWKKDNKDFVFVFAFRFAKIRFPCFPLMILVLYEPPV